MADLGRSCLNSILIHRSSAMDVKTATLRISCCRWRASKIELATLVAGDWRRRYFLLFLHLQLILFVEHFHFAQFIDESIQFDCRQKVSLFAGRCTFHHESTIRNPAGINETTFSGLPSDLPHLFIFGINRHHKWEMNKKLWPAL